MKIRIRRGTKQSSFQKYAMIKVIGDPKFNAFQLSSNKDGVFGEFNIDLNPDRQEVLRCTPSYESAALKEGIVNYDTITLVSESAVNIEDTIEILRRKIMSHYSDVVSKSKRKEECERKWQTDEDEVVNLDM